MKKIILIIALLVMLLNCQTIKIASTISCTNMLTERRAESRWDQKKKVCGVTETQTTPIDRTTVAVAANYGQFNTAEECPKKNPCAWNILISFHCLTLCK